MLKNFFKAGFGGAGAQIINLLALPIISRLYTPEAYATWAIVMATAGIFGSIACFRYELAIVIPQNENEASSVFWWCISSATVFSLAIFLVLQIPWMAVIIKQQAGPTWFYSLFSPLLIATMGISFALQYWNVRQRAFMMNSFSQIALALVTLAVQYAYAVLITPSSAGLLIGSLAGQLALIGICLVGFKYMTRPNLNGSIIINLPTVLTKYHRFLFYSTPYTLFGMVRARASLLVLDHFVTNREVGLYAFAYRIMNFPVSLISGAMRPVIFKETADKGTKALESQINNILKVIVFVGTPMIVIYFFYAEEIFRLIFGEKWLGAGTMGKFIILPVFTFMFCNWMDRIMDVLGQQRLVLLLEIFFASSSILGLFLGFFLQLGLHIALGIQCSILVLYNICYLYTAYDKAGYDSKVLIRLLFMIIFIASFTSFSITWFNNS